MGASDAKPALACNVGELHDQEVRLEHLQYQCMLSYKALMDSEIRRDSAVQSVASAKELVECKTREWEAAKKHATRAKQELRVIAANHAYAMHQLGKHRLCVGFSRSKLGVPSDKEGERYEK